MAHYVRRGMLMLVAVGIGSNLCCSVLGVQGAIQPSFEAGYMNPLASSPAGTNDSVVTAAAAAARLPGGRTRTGVAPSMNYSTRAVQPGASSSRYLSATSGMQRNSVGLASRKEDLRHEEEEDEGTGPEEAKTHKLGDEGRKGKRGGHDAAAAGKLEEKEPTTEKVTTEKGEVADEGVAEGQGKEGHKCTCEKHGNEEEQRQQKTKLEGKESEKTPTQANETLSKLTKGGQDFNAILDAHGNFLEPPITKTYVPLLYTHSDGRKAE